MGKNPAFQFYPSDWTRDLDDYPLEIEGAWIRICCRLHWSNPYGQATKTLTEWAFVLRTHPNKARVILKTLLEKHIASGEYLDNQSITIISRRMINDERIRKIRQEVGRLGGNPKLKKDSKGLVKQSDNQKCRSSSSSSSSSSKRIKNKESISHSDTKIFLSFYREKFIECFGTEPQIEWGKDGSITSKLLKTIQVDELKSLLEAFFISEDKFIRQSGYTIGVFKTQINKLKIGTSSPHSGLRVWAKEIIEEENGRER